MCLVELELQLQGGIGQAAPPLEQGDGLVQPLLKGHTSPPAQNGETASRNWPRQFSGATSRAQHRDAVLARLPRTDETRFIGQDNALNTYKARFGEPVPVL